MKRTSPHIFKLLIAIIVVLITYASSFAEEKDSRGKEFWFTFIPNLHVNNPPTDSLYIYIAASEPTSGTIKYRGSTGGWNSVNFTITDPSRIFKLPIHWFNIELQGQVLSDGQSSINNQCEKVAQNVFNIVSDNEVSVYALNQASTTSDAFLVLPIDALGTDHYVLTYNNDKQGTGTIPGNGSTPSEFAIVAAYDGTDVTITPSVSTSSSNSKNPITVSLQQGQSYLVQANLTVNNGAGDLTGTRVQSSKPIALFAGQQRARIPINNSNLSSRDHIVEQLPSVDTWGRTAIVVPFPNPISATTQSQDLYRVIAAYDSTDIFINGIKATTLFKGGMYQSVLTTPQVISSNKSIMAAGFKKTSGAGQGGGFTDYNGDPFMMLFPPSDQFQDNYRFISVQAVNITQGFEIENGYEEQWITVVMPNSAIQNTELDGTKVNSLNKVSIIPITGTNYSYAWVPVGDGVHSVTSNEPVGIYSYGYGKANSYGYVGGMSFRSFDFNPPLITGNQECRRFKGVVYDTVAGDSHIAKAYQEPGSAVNVKDVSFTITKPVDSLTFDAELIDPFQDGKVNITAIDSVGQKTTKTIQVKGFTVATPFVRSNNAPENIAIKSPTGKEACIAITIENYGGFEQSITPRFSSQGTVLYTIKTSLPIILKPGEKKTFDVCAISTQDTQSIDTIYLTDDCVKREIAVISLKTYSDKNNPIITQKSDSCKHCFTVNITDSTEIDAGLLTTAVTDVVNMEWSYQGALIDTYRTMSFCIVDSYKDAFYSVEAQDKNGNKSVFRDTIPGFTLSISPNPNNPRKLGGKPIGGLYCDSLLIKNTGLFPQNIDAAFLAKNVLFSVPQSQLPLLLEPGKEIYIRYCYSPIQPIDTSYQDQRDKDTIRIGRNCTTIPIFLEAFGIDDIHDTTSKCNVTIKTAVIELPELKIANVQLYPQPAFSGAGHEQLQFDLWSQDDLSVHLYHAFSNSREVIYQKSLAIPGSYAISFSVDNKEPGLYFIEIQSSNAKQIIPCIINQ